MEVIGVVTAGLAFATAVKDVIEVAIKLKASFDSVPFCIQSLKDDANGIVLILRDIETIKQQYGQIADAENEVLPDVQSLSRGLSGLHNKHVELLTNVLSPSPTWHMPGFRSAQKALRAWYYSVKDTDDITRLRSLAASLLLRYQVITTARIHSDVRLLVNMNLALIRETPGGRRAMYHRRQIKLIYAELLRDPDTSRTLSSIWLRTTMALLASYEGEQHSTFRLLDQSFEQQPYRGKITISNIAYDSARNIYLCKATHIFHHMRKANYTTTTTDIIIGASFDLPLEFEELQLAPVQVQQTFPARGTPEEHGLIDSVVGTHMKIQLQHQVSVCSTSGPWEDGLKREELEDERESREEKEESINGWNGWREKLRWEPEPEDFSELLGEHV